MGWLRPRRGLRLRVRARAGANRPASTPGSRRQALLDQRPAFPEAVLRLPVSWLKDYVDVPSPLAEVANRLAVATAEVDRIIRRGIPDTDGNLGLYKIGRVLEAGKHP